MHISKPKIIQQGSFIRISAEVTMDTSGKLPGELWFEIPAEDVEAIDHEDMDMSPFVLGLIFPAMRLNRDISVEGSMSESLFYALEELQIIFSGWYKNLHPIKIHVADSLRTPTEVACKQRDIVTCFSGGVDSFHTLRKHYSHFSPRYRVTHALFGLFGPPFHWSKPDLYNQAFKTYDSMLADMGVKLLSVRTNAYDFSWALKIAWEIPHAFITAASMHIFGSKFSKGYIPSSFHFKNLFVWGSHPLTDPLLSTENTQIVHDSVHTTRIEKVQYIADWEPAQKHLNVCTVRTPTNQNCGRCSKCLRTILELACTPHFKNFSTFPHDANGNFQIMKEDLWHMQKPKERQFLQDTLAIARKEGKRDLVNLLTSLLEKPVIN